MLRPHDSTLPEVALFGTFDVKNYGDLLFPHLVAQGLRGAISGVQAYSPKGGVLDWADTVISRPVTTAIAADPQAKLCLIGGGNIIHATESPLAEYKGLLSDPRFAYASLWLGAAVISAHTGAKIVWNAPGVPYPIEGEWARRLKDLALEASEHIAVRDHASSAFLGAPHLPISVLPDTALDLARMWPAAALKTEAMRAFECRRAVAPARWIVFHLNPRYIEGNLNHIAGIIERICISFDAVPVLVAIGPCHGDDVLARRVWGRLPGRGLLVDRPRGLKEIAGLIAHAVGYAGSSLHGMITALAYRRPGLVVASARMPKFLGFLEQLDMAKRFQESWQEAEAAAERLLVPLDQPTQATIALANAKIAAHWLRVRRLLAEPDCAPKVEARTRLLHCVKENIHALAEWSTLLADLTQATPSRPARRRSPSRGLPSGGCNICGGQVFDGGPPARPNRQGQSLVCRECGSCEWHRTFRFLFDKFRRPHFKNFSCVTFGNDVSVDRNWFQKTEIADTTEPEIPEGPHSAYDVVVCNNMLQHASDCGSEFRKLARITRPNGFIFLSFPDPYAVATTSQYRIDGGRIFGRDVEAMLQSELGSHHILRLFGEDPITGEQDLAYVLTRSDRVVAEFFEGGLAARIVHIRDEHGPGPLGVSVDPKNGREAAEDIARMLRDWPDPLIEARLAEAVRQWPYEVRLYLLQGEWFEKIGEPEKAMDHLRGLQQMFPENPWVSVRLVRLLAANDALPEARKIFATRVWQSSAPQEVQEELVSLLSRPTQEHHDTLAFLESLLSESRNNGLLLARISAIRTLRGS